MDTAPQTTPPDDTASSGTGPAPDDRPGSTRSTSTSTSSERGDHDHLHRGGESRMLAGVAAGLADYFDVDPTLVRIGFVALAFMGGLAVPLYLAGWLLIPDADRDLSVAEELLARERAYY